jgi:hypothetical protein
MENDRHLLAAAIFALAVAYFLTNLHKVTQQPLGGEGDRGGVHIYNSVTGNVTWFCFEETCYAAKKE